MSWHITGRVWNSPLSSGPILFEAGHHRHTVELLWLELLNFNNDAIFARRLIQLEIRYSVWENWQKWSSSPCVVCTSLSCRFCTLFVRALKQRSCGYGSFHFVEVRLVCGTNNYTMRESLWIWKQNIMPKRCVYKKTSWRLVSTFCEVRNSCRVEKRGFFVAAFDRASSWLWLIKQFEIL